MNGSMEEAILYAKKYLEDMLSFFGLITDVYATSDDEVIQLNVPSTHLNGFLIGREVFLDRVPGIVVAYNITRFGHFIGNAYPLVIRTAYGVTKCRMNDVSLA